ncbi:uncharacterized protein PFLUO_LOCUS4856 [Penicillium psychrofluorescens]|uniref:uncharacterized protein n=1 Tax=Penicillium psychrofluorescens TaxID=3158075 RepID=UPI003CCE26AF
MASPSPSPKPPTHIAQTLLSRAHSPDTTNQQFTERIKQKPLFLRATSPSAADNRSRRRQHRLRKKEHFLRHQRPRPLSAREKRSSGIYDLPREECKYAIFRELHALWTGYMQDLLDLRSSATAVNAMAHGSKLVSADFHGAEVEVVRSAAGGRVGIKGIVVRDTKFTFVVVTEKDEVKTVPKEQSIFRFTVPLPTPSVESGQGEARAEIALNDQNTPKPLVFELHGSQFQNRPVDRANKKFKWKNVEYL